jgi:hypothetical protein
VVRRKTVAEVYEALRDALGNDEHGYVNLPGVDEYLSLGPEYKYRPNPRADGLELPGDIEWPDGRIAVLSVNGSSEGDYVHVEVYAREGEQVVSHLVFLGKSVRGRDAAWAAARRIADLLGAWTPGMRA